MDQAGGTVRHTTTSCGGSGGTNYLSPILFHRAHWDIICISEDGKLVKRVSASIKGVAFSNRPVRVAEKVCVKFLGVSMNNVGGIRFGFTSNDPSNLGRNRIKYVNEDMTNKPGFWTMELPREFAERDNVLFYYVTQAGNGHFGINGEEKGAFNCGIDVKKPLWAIFDLSGSWTAIELVDPQQQPNNSSSNLHTGYDKSPGNPIAMGRHIPPYLAALKISQQNHQHPMSQRSATDDATTNDMPGSRIQQPGNVFNPLPFHTTHGRNIRMSNDRCIASRADAEFCNGYVFTARPIQLGEMVVIKVLATETNFIGELAFGLTSCDPDKLQGAQLPDDSDFLLDRPEYWVVSKDIASSPQRGDTLSFCVTHTGEVQLSKNGSTPMVCMHVDQTIQLWAFFDVYGNTKKVLILGSCVEPHHPHTFSGSRNSSPSPTFIDPHQADGHLRVNLPFSVTNQSQPPLQKTQHLQQSSQISIPVDLQPSSSGPLLSTSTHTYIEPVTATSYSTLDSTVTTQQSANATAATGGSGTKCTICCERPIDGAFYTCGHMCMCYECAVQQWRGMGGGHCPLCREFIRDVLRIIKS